MANDGSIAPGHLPASFPRGTTLLQDPTLNKGTAFTAAERDALGLRGLLPPHISTQGEQVKRVLENFRRKASDLERYINLAALHDRNETLFYRVVVDNPDEMMPIIYTPTVGLACQQFGHIFQRPRGLFISHHDRGRIRDMLRNWPHKDVRMIVVTDGERILGLGDLGANGMGIPVGKLSLYTACAGVHPNQCLPVLLDAGTNNEVLRHDPLYIGVSTPRVTGIPYDELVEEFVTATQEVFPGVVVQFEDFANHNAFRLLERYRDRLATFNDDIQGTAAVALAGLLTALRVKGGALRNETLLFQGAGEAATGIADLAVAAMVDEGMPEAEARRRCWLVDSKGLVVQARTDLAHHKQRYAHQHPHVSSLLAAVEALRPTAIIGVAAVGGAFTQEVVTAMSAINERPIVFSLSNPTSKSECTAQQAYEWSRGRALFASGSPFPAVSLGDAVFVSRQGNNSYIFPGVGMGAIVSRTTRVTDEMFLVAARTLAAQVTAEDLAQGSLYPPLPAIREVSAHIAAAVADVAFKRGLAGVARPADLLAAVKSAMYEPEYATYA
jgi:malate dehydrogenase (oxaloacetate-decarboxylating)(NADP+)